MHTLQTGWCFYSGLDTAKRSNVWVASQSPAALAMLAAAGATAAGGSPGTDRSRPQSGSPASESLMQVRAHARTCPHTTACQFSASGRRKHPGGTAQQTREREEATIASDPVCCVCSDQHNR